MADDMTSEAWPDALYELLRANGVTQFCYVPDAGHKVLIDRSLADADVHSIPLTTEEEGIAMVAGGDLGGRVALGLLVARGVEFGEGIPWQLAMGEAVEPVLKAMGVIVLRADQPS